MCSRWSRDVASMGLKATTVTTTLVAFTLLRPSPAVGRGALAAAAAAAHLMCVAGEESGERAGEATADCRVALLRRVDNVLSDTPKEAYLSGAQRFRCRCRVTRLARLSVDVSVALWLCARVPIRPPDGPPRPW